MKLLNNLKTACLVLALAALSLTACDANIAHPEDLVNDYSISISKFTADDSTVEIGKSTMLRWDVSDTNSKVTTVNISPEVGTVPAGGGAKLVTPNSSTLYTLTVYAGTEAVAAQTRLVTVLTADLQEVTEPATTEICNDTIDNDLDGETDCNDSDCSEDDICQENLVFEWKTTPFISIPQESPKAGDTVTIAWDSSFYQVIVSGSKSGVFGSAGEFDLIAVDADVEYSFVFTVYGENGQVLSEFSETFAFEIVTPIDEVVPFGATINSFDATPSLDLIAGQPYIVSWSILDASLVELDGVAVDDLNNGSEDFFAIAGNPGHTLTVTDKNDPAKVEDATPISLTVAGFETNGLLQYDDDDIQGSIIKVKAGSNEGEYYIITDQAVYFTEDSFAELERVVRLKDITDAQEKAHAGDYIAFDENFFAGEEITAFDVKGSEYFIGSKFGVYIKSDDETKEIETTAGSQAIVDLHIMNVEEDEYKIITTAGNKTYELESYEPADKGEDAYRSIPLASLEGGNVSVVQLVVNPTNKDEFYAVTANNGVWYTADQGAAFEQLSGALSDVVGGSWVSADSLFLWSQDVLYALEAESKTEWVALEDVKATKIIQSINGQVHANSIQYAIKVADRYFIATEAGVFSTYTDDAGLITVFITNNIDSTDIILPIKTEDDASYKIKTLDKAGVLKTLFWGEAAAQSTNSNVGGGTWTVKRMERLPLNFKSWNWNNLGKH